MVADEEHKFPEKHELCWQCKAREGFRNLPEKRETCWRCKIEEHFRGLREWISNHPDNMNFLALGLGFAIIAFEFLLELVLYYSGSGIGGSTWSNLIYTVGGSLICGAFLNIYKESVVSTPVHTITLESYEESPEMSKRARSDQEIEIDMFLSEDGTKLCIRTTHEFSYDNQRITRRQPFKLLSDFRDEGTNSSSYQSYFQRIQIYSGGERQVDLDWNEESDKCKLNQKERGNLCFRYNIEIRAKTKTTFLFKTYKEYRLSDRLFWPFQEASKDVRIKITNRTGEYVDRENSYIRFSAVHPQERNILEFNSHCIDNNGILKENVNDIRFYPRILPYQSFVLSWELEKNSECRVPGS